MASSPTDRVYNSKHQWIMKGDSPVKMGITAFGASQTGTANAVLLPERDKHVRADENIGKVAGAHGTIDLLGIADGDVPDRNDILCEGPMPHPEFVTNDPFGLGPTGGWLIKLKITGADPRDSMMSAEQYDAEFPFPQSPLGIPPIEERPIP